MKVNFKSALIEIIPLSKNVKVAVMSDSRIQINRTSNLMQEEWCQDRSELCVGD
jgi:hypothetical protein